MECCELLNAEGLGASVGRDRSCCEGGGDCLSLKTGGAKIIRQSLTFLRECDAGESLEGGALDGQLWVTRMHDEAQDGGVDLRARGERFGRQGEEIFNRGGHLHGNGEQAEVAAAGLRGDAFADLALHHDDGGFDSAGVLDEMQQDVGGDVVGEISDDDRLAVRTETLAN